MHFLDVLLGICRIGQYGDDIAQRKQPLLVMPGAADGGLLKHGDVVGWLDVIGWFCHDFSSFD